MTFKCLKKKTEIPNEHIAQINATSRREHVIINTNERIRHQNALHKKCRDSFLLKQNSTRITCTKCSQRRTAQNDGSHNC
jgi:hypothetical protein